MHLPTDDISLLHSAIPFLPVPAAILCFFLNFFVAGLGNLLKFSNINYWTKIFYSRVLTECDRFNKHSAIKLLHPYFCVLLYFYIY